MNKNKNCSMYEVVALYALDKAFPTLEFINEYQLKKIDRNIDGKRKYDIYSPVYNIAIEVSRSFAHKISDIPRDNFKQKFSELNDVEIYHIRDICCAPVTLTNCVTFVDQTDDSLGTIIKVLEESINEVIDMISKKFSIQRQEFIFEHKEIEKLYLQIKGKPYTSKKELKDMNIEEAASFLNCTVDYIKKVSTANNLTTDKAIFIIHKTPKYIDSDTGICYKNEFAKNQAIKERNKILNLYKDISSDRLSDDRKNGKADIQLCYKRKND